MRKIVAITHLTLDGIMQAPGGPKEDPSGRFTHGGWSMAYGGEEAGEVLGEIMAGKFDLLLGRRTYDIWAAYWPNAGDNFIAKAFNEATKFVVTHRRKKLDWVKSEPISGKVVDGIRRLKASNGPDLHVWGSGELLQTLIAADLVDEFRVWVYPVILGTGKRLFEKGVPPRAFTLVESRATSDGVLLNTYRLAGALRQPSPESGKPAEAKSARGKRPATKKPRR